MLALVAIFLVTMIVSATAIWVYRKLSVFYGFTNALVSRPESTATMEICAQHGSITLVPRRRKIQENTKLRRSKGKNDTPWGW